MLLLISFLFCLNNVNANDDLDSLPTGLYFADSSGGTAVYQVDRHGNKLKFIPPETPAERKRAAELLAQAPDVNLEVNVFQGASDKKMTLNEVFNLKYEFSEVKVEKRGKKVTHLKTSKKESFKICEDSRSTLGKLMLCLKRSELMVERYIATVKETLNDVDDPAIRAELENKLDTMQQLMKILRGSFSGLNDQYQLGNLHWHFPKNQSVNVDKGITANNMKWPRQQKEKEKEEPEPIEVAKNKSGRFHALLQDCAYELDNFRDSQKYGYEYIGKVACMEIRGQVPPFVEYNAELVKNITLDAYFDLLRAKAVEKFAKANRALTGHDLDPANLPNQCYPLDRDLRRFAAEPKTKMPLKDSVAYAYEIHEQAVKVKALQEKGAKLSEFLQQSGVEICHVFDIVDTCKRKQAATQEWPKKCDQAVNKEKELAVENADELAQKMREGKIDSPCVTRNRSKRMELFDEVKKRNTAEVVDILGRYPFLALNHSGSDIEKNLPYVQKFANAKPPQEVRQLMDQAAKESARDITKAAHKFCQKMDSDDWEWLIGMDSLHNAVVADVPELKGVFDAIHNCAKKEKKQYEDNAEMLSIVGKASCLAAALGSVGILGPVCMLASVPEIYSAAKDTIASSKDREFTRQCIQANSNQPEFRDNVCSSKDYVAAMARYEDAVANFRNNMIGAGVDGLELYKNVKNFQQAAKFMNPQEVGEYIEKLEQVKNLNDAKELSESATKRFIKS